MPPEAKGNARQPVATSGHRVSLEGDWSLWRTVCVRATGFPFVLLRPVEDSELAREADALLAAEAAVDIPLRAAKAHISSRLKSKAGDAAAYRRALRRLRQRQTPSGLDYDDRLMTLCQTLEIALEDVLRIRRGYVDSWHASTSRVSRYLKTLASENRFREAITWQNLAVVERALDPFVQSEHRAKNKSVTKATRLIARYLQRYCTRNESIGFFGPVAWGTLADEGAPLNQKIGIELVDRHDVHLEYWAARAIAAAIMQDPELKGWIVPRRYPGVVLEGTTAVGAFGQQANLAPPLVKILDTSLGSCTATQLAKRLVAQCPGLFASPADVYATLERAVAAGLVIWEPQLPLIGPPEQQVRRLLESIGESRARDPLLAEWNRVEAALADLRAAFGDAQRVRTSLATLNQYFEKLTGQASVRRAGMVYAGRTLAFLDCRRDYHLTLGPAIRQRLAPALSLTLDSVRWFTAQLAAQFLDFIAGHYEAVSRKIARKAVPLGMLWAQIQANEPVARAVVDDVLDQLHERWGALLQIGANETPVKRKSCELLARARELFTASGPGWPGARHHSPDLMLGARNAQEICAGGGYFVLGEIHVGVITVNQQNFLEFHPDPTSLVQAVATDRPEPEVEPVRTMEKGGQRVGSSADTGVNFQIEYDDTPAWLANDRVLAIADVVVESSPDGLVLRTRDGRHSFPAISFFGRQTLGLFMQRFGLIAPQPHRPRVSIDDLVISRESWRFPREALSFAEVRDEAQRYLGARSFMREHRLPRYMFYRVPGEPKPIYLDWESPLMVEVFAHSVRGSKQREDWSASLTEMLPGPEDLWFEGPNGERYTSELRLTAVDGRGHSTS